MHFLCCPNQNRVKTEDFLTRQAKGGWALPEQDQVSPLTHATIKLGFFLSLSPFYWFPTFLAFTSFPKLSFSLPFSSEILVSLLLFLVKLQFRSIMVECSIKSEQGGDLFLPPGFRFHPTDEEVITSYLLQKFLNPSFDPRAMVEVDLNKCEPWDLPSKSIVHLFSWSLLFFNCTTTYIYTCWCRKLSLIWAD